MEVLPSTGILLAWCENISHKNEKSNYRCREDLLHYIYYTEMVNVLLIAT